MLARPTNLICVLVFLFTRIWLTEFEHLQTRSMLERLADIEILFQMSLAPLCVRDTSSLIQFIRTDSSLCSWLLESYTVYPNRLHFMFVTPRWINDSESYTVYLNRLHDIQDSLNRWQSSVFSNRFQDVPDYLDRWLNIWQYLTMPQTLNRWH